MRSNTVLNTTDRAKILKEEALELKKEADRIKFEQECKNGKPIENVEEFRYKTQAERDQIKMNDCDNLK